MTEECEHKRVHVTIKYRTEYERTGTLDVSLEPEKVLRVIEVGKPVTTDSSTGRTVSSMVCADCGEYLDYDFYTRISEFAENRW